MSQTPDQQATDTPGSGDQPQEDLDITVERNPETAPASSAAPAAEPHSDPDNSQG